METATRRVIGAAVLCALVAGCRQDFPLLQAVRNSIDKRLMGTWDCREPGEKDPLGTYQIDRDPSRRHRYVLSELKKPREVIAAAFSFRHEGLTVLVIADPEGHVSGADYLWYEFDGPKVVRVEFLSSNLIESSPEAALNLLASLHKRPLNAFAECTLRTQSSS